MRPATTTRTPLVLFLVALLMNAVLWAGTWAYMRPISTITPLHYTIYFGIDLATDKQWLYLIPGLGLLVVLSHSLFARLTAHPAWAEAWSTLAVLFQVLLGMVLLTLVVLSHRV